MSNVRVTISNNKNAGTDPNTNVSIPADGKAYKIGDLTFDPKPKTFPQILATNLQFNSPQDVEVTFSAGGKGVTVTFKAGAYQDISSQGQAVDIAPYTLSAKKVS